MADMFCENRCLGTLPIELPRFYPETGLEPATSRLKGDNRSSSDPPSGLCNCAQRMWQVKHRFLNPKANPGWD